MLRKFFLRRRSESDEAEATAWTARYSEIVPLARRDARRHMTASIADALARDLGYASAMERARADGGDAVAAEVYARRGEVDRMIDVSAGLRFMYLRTFALVLKDGDVSPDSPLLRFVNSKGVSKRLLSFLKDDQQVVVLRFHDSDGKRLLSDPPLVGRLPNFSATMLSLERNHPAAWTPQLVAHGPQAGFVRHSRPRGVDRVSLSSACREKTASCLQTSTDDTWVHMCKPSGIYHREGQLTGCWLEGSLPLAEDAPYLAIEFAFEVIRSGYGAGQHILGHAEALFSLGATAPEEDKPMCLLTFQHQTLQFGRQYSARVELTREKDAASSVAVLEVRQFSHTERATRVLDTDAVLFRCEKTCLRSVVDGDNAKFFINYHTWDGGRTASARLEMKMSPVMITSAPRRFC